MNPEYFTRRADRQEEERIIRKRYITTDNKVPTKIFWFDSPTQAIKAAESYKFLGPSRRINFQMATECVHEHDIINRRFQKISIVLPTESFQKSTGRKRITMRNCYGAFTFGDALRLRFDFFSEAVSTQAIYPSRRFEENCHFHFALLFKHVAFVSERPVEIFWDDAGEPHRESGLALTYADGTGEAFWHGVNIPPEWVSEKKITAEEALRVENMDLRAAACEIVGWENVLKDIDAEVVDDSGDETWGVLVQTNILNRPKPSLWGDDVLDNIGVLPGNVSEMMRPMDARVIPRAYRNEKFLIAKCGTGRTVVLPVPDHINTVDQAQSALHGGIPAEVLRHSVRRT